MSTNEKTDVVTDLDDSFFDAYASKMQKEQKQNNQSNFTPRDFEEIAFAGLDTGVNKIFRIIGAPPGADTAGYTRKDHDSIIVMMAEVKDDDGKKFNIKLPQREDVAAKNHILHRLYDRVMEATWINKKKIFVNESKYPELWAAVTKTGYSAEKDGKSYSYAAGLKSTNVVVFNVIDRQDDWCEKNKHTKIVARQLNVDDKGRVWATPGLKAFGFVNKLNDLITKYKNFEKYDVAIKKTGEQQNPFELKNASVYKQKDLLEELKNADGTLPEADIIVVGPLTEAEVGYERYNLTKLYQPTSYTKILKRLPSVFKLCDSCLGTKFYDELVSLSEKEKEEWKKLYGTEDETAQASAENAAIKEELKDPETKPAHRKAVVGAPAHGLSEEKIAALIGWSKIKESQRALIEDVKIKDGKVVEIKWVDCKETENLLACDCDIASPDTFEHCPACGASFV